MRCSPFSINRQTDIADDSLKCFSKYRHSMVKVAVFFKHVNNKTINCLLLTNLQRRIFQ